MAPVVGIIVFILLLVLDILGHRKLAVMRKPIDRGFLCFFAAGLILCIIIALVGAAQNNHGSTEAEYLAYRYLMDEDPKSADEVLMQDNKINDENKNFLNMLIYASEGNYEKLYFTAADFLNDSGSLTSQEGVAGELYDIALRALKDGTASKEDIQEQIEKSYEIAGIAETSELQTYYEIDSLVRNGNADEVSASRINALEGSFPDNESVKKLGISYYIQIDDFDHAKEWAADLVKSSGTADNQIILCDVYAQCAYQASDSEIKASEDQEISALVVKSEAASKMAASYTEKNNDYDVQTDLAAGYIDEARNVQYKRVLNYLYVKRPVMSDSTGMYDLETVKMEVLSGNIEFAYSTFSDLIGRASSLDENSKIRTSLLDLASDMESYENSGDESLEETIFQHCEELFSVQGQDVISGTEESINAVAAEELAACIIYDRKVMTITGYDVSTANKIGVYVNTNDRKNNIIGGEGEFYKDDFVITDNGEEITDYALSADTSTGDRSLAVALDINSSSVETLRDVRTMLENMAADSESAQRLALIDGNADILSGFSESEAHFNNAVRDLTTGHDAGSSDIILAAVEALTENNYDDRVLVIVTDDLQATESQLQVLTQKLKDNNIVCYVICMEGADEDAAGTLTGAARGIYVSAARSGELSAAMNFLTDFMNNCYIFIYKTDSADGSLHDVCITLPEDALSAEITFKQEEDA